MERKRNFFFSITLLLMCSTGFAQPFELIRSVSLTAQVMTTDKLGHVYLIHSGGELQMISANSDTVFRFSDIASGIPVSADASTPFKILLFNPLTGRVIFLDQALTEISRIDLVAGGYASVVAVCRAADAAIWIFDLSTQHLIKLNDQLQVMTQSEDLRMTECGALYPAYMTEAADQVFVTDTARGIFVFDRYGTFVRKIFLTGIHTFQVQGDNILWLNDGMLMKYNINTLQSETVMLPVQGNVLAARIERGMLALLLSDRVNLYRY